METQKHKFQWLPMLALAFAYGATYNPPYIRYIVYDTMIQALGCTNAQLGFLTTFYVITNAISIIPGGVYADRIGAKKGIIISLLLNIPVILLAAMFLKVYWIQLFAWGVMGVTGGGIFWPACLKAVRLIGGKDHQETTWGLFEAGQGIFATIGNLIAMWLFTMFVNQIFGYQATFICQGLYCGVAALFMAFFYKDGESDYEEELEAASTSSESAIQGYLRVIKNPYTWILAVVIFSVYGIYVNNSYFTPYFTGVLKASVVITGFFAIFRDYGSKAVGGPIGGLVAKWLHSPALLNGICLCLNACLIFTVWHLDPSTNNIVPICIAFVLVNAIVATMAKATMWAVVDEAEMPIELAGKAVSVISLIGFIGPDAVFPVFNGTLLDIYADNIIKAYNIWFTVLIVMCVIGAACAFFIWFKHRKKKTA